MNLLATLAFSFLAVAPARPTLVACVGDSITVGVGASSPAADYPSVLQALLGAETTVAGFGHSGATLLSTGDLPYMRQDEYARALDFVSSAGPAARVAVVIVLGANDSKAWNWRPDGKTSQTAQFEQDYATLARAFSPKARVYLALPLATGKQPCCGIDGQVIHDEEIPLIRGLSQGDHLPLIDLYSPTEGRPELFVDGVHPNDAGYRTMAHAVFDVLTSN